MSEQNGFGKPDPGAIKAQQMEAVAVKAEPKKPMRLDAATLDAEIEEAQRPRRPDISALGQPMAPASMYRRLSDQELIEDGLFDPEGTQFEIPEDIIPDGMVYQWKRFEVFGQSDRRTPATAERNGWRAVPASRHPGRFMPESHEGPIELDGLRLYELPEAEAYNRARREYLKAKMQRQNANEMLYQSPAGTGPRTHPMVRPDVKVSRVPASVIPVE